MDLRQASDAILAAIGEPDAEFTTELRYALAPPPDIDAADYAERHIVLPHGTTARSGQYSYTAAPYSEEWLRVMSDRAVPKVTLITSTQVGKTTALLLTLCWGVACDPCPMLWVGPRGSDVAYMIKHRLMPSMRGSPDLARHLTGMRSDEKKDEITFANGAIIYTGTGRSAASLRSKPIKLAIGDEVSDWPATPKKHEGAHGVRLMSERTRTWGSEGRIVIATTPTVEDEAGWREYQKSDRRRYWLPCPHCAGWQQLEEQQLRWTGDDPEHIEDAHYLCRHCDERILDSEKLPAMQQGKWVPEAVAIDERTGEVAPHDLSPHRGYQLGALYSPWLTWGQYVHEMLMARRDPAKLQQFVNLWRGLPYRPITQSITPAVASSRVIPSLPRGSVHERVEVLTAGVDVQSDHMVWVVRGWGRDEESWLVDHGHAPTWSDLMRLLTEVRWPQEGNARGMLVTMACVDMADGKRANEVYALAREYPHLVVPARGHELKAIPVQRRRLTAASKVVGGEGLEYALWSNPWFFAKLSAAMHAQPGQRGAWWTCADVERDYIEQLQGTQLQVTQRPDGTRDEQWVDVGPNHYWDAECMAMVAAELCGATRLVGEGIAPQDVRAPEPQDIRPMADRIREEKRRWTTGRSGGWAIRPGRR